MDFRLPIDVDRLQNHRLYLVPFEHCTKDNLEEFFDETCNKHPEIWNYFPAGPFPSLQAYQDWFINIIGASPETQSTCQIFAIFLKSGTITRQIPNSADSETFEVEHGTFAGTTGLIDASPAMSMVEIGHVIVLPRFQRTFVNTDAHCLLLKHLLGSLETGDLNMRRVQWTTSSENKASIRAAQRLGMTLEGIIRWSMVMEDNKRCVSESMDRSSAGKPVIDRVGRRLGPGRHTAVLSMCWDDWLDGKRDHVEKLLERA